MTRTGLSIQFVRALPCCSPGRRFEGAVAAPQHNWTSVRCRAWSPPPPAHRRAASKCRSSECTPLSTGGQPSGGSVHAPPLSVVCTFATSKGVLCATDCVHSGCCTDAPPPEQPPSSAPQWCPQVPNPRVLSTNRSEWDARMLITQNTIEDVATEFRGAAAVFAGYVASTRIDRNTIRGTGYTAISLGWGWGNHVLGPQTFARDNHITNNHITAVMAGLNDGGCTYTLGPQPVCPSYSCRYRAAPRLSLSYFRAENSKHFSEGFEMLLMGYQAPPKG